MTVSVKTLVLILALILGSFVVLVQGQSLAPVSAHDAQKWRADLHYLSLEMPKRHKSLFHSMTREQFDAAVSRLDERIPSLTRNQILVEVARIVAMVGDGHTSLFPFFNPTLDLHRYPIKFYLFKEGLYVQRGAPAYREVVGGKVVRIGNLDAEKAYRRMSEIVNRDNEMTVKDVTPDWLGFPEFLEGLGIVDNMEDAALTVDKDGKQIAVQLKPITMEAAHNLTWVDASDGAANPLPLWRKDPQNPYWFEYLKDSQTLYLKYNTVEDKSDEKLADFFHRVFAFIDANPVDRLVIDIRNNGGGNGYLNWPLIYGIIRSDKINQRGKLFAITGRMTFSAAGMCAVYLERHTNALFVGEPTGSSPNGYGEHGEITLPNSSIKVFVSTLYWQEADPRDRRPWIAPQIAADPTFEDYRNNVDPAMRAILSYVPQPPLTEVVRAAVLDKDVEGARRAIRKYRADPVNSYANFESDLNRLGYMLMGQKQLETAIQVFQLNVESYPDSANVYDSLAEAYANHGDRELAIKNYEKSVQLNPNNQGAEEALRGLLAHIAQPSVPEPHAHVEKNVVVADAPYRLKITLDPKFQYLGCFPFDIKGIAGGYRYVWGETDSGNHLGRTFIVQAEGYYPGNQGSYNYRTSNPATLASNVYQHNVWIYDNDQSAQGDPGNESDLTRKFIRDKGYEWESQLVMSRFARIVNESRKNEIIFFYFENLKHYTTKRVSDFPDEGESAEQKVILDAVDANSRAAFMVAH